MIQSPDAPNTALSRWLAERQRALHIQRTTRTRRGTVLDWIPLESQFEGGKIPTAPPSPARMLGFSSRDRCRQR
jgi:hypothetical protein